MIWTPPIDIRQHGPYTPPPLSTAIATIEQRADRRYDTIECGSSGIIVKLVRFWSPRDEFFAVLNMPGAQE